MRQEGTMSRSDCELLLLIYEVFFVVRPAWRLQKLLWDSAHNAGCYSPPPTEGPWWTVATAKLIVVCELLSLESPAHVKEKKKML